MVIKGKTAGVVGILERVCNYVIVILFCLMIIFAFAQVLFRYALSYSAPWTEELARYLMIWMVFIGCAVGVRLESHIKIDIFERVFPVRVMQMVSILTTLLGLVASIAYLIFSTKHIIFLAKSGDTSITLGISMAIPATAMLVGAFLMVVFFCLNIYKRLVHS